MSKPHIIYLGDRSKAFRWAGFAKNRFNAEVERQGPNFQTAIEPRADTRIEMRSFGDVKAITITVTPPLGATFVGVPYDYIRYDGWGSPYEATNEFSEVQPRTTGGALYGTEGGDDHKEVLLKGEKKGGWQAIRYPRYQAKYPDIQYGSMQWTSFDRTITLSWDGLNSRHREVVPNIDDVFYGLGSCETTLNNGTLFIGHVYTGGDLCSEEPPGYGIQSNLYKVTGVREGAMNEDPVANQPYWNPSESHYDKIEALSGKVYRDGKLLWEHDGEEKVTGACLVKRTDKEGIPYDLLRVILGTYDVFFGMISEKIVQIRLGETSEEDTILYEEELLDYNVVFTLVGDLTLNRPYANCNLAVFSESGNKVLFHRDFYKDYGTPEFSRWYFYTRVIEFTIQDEESDEYDGTTGTGFVGMSISPDTLKASIAASEREVWHSENSPGVPQIVRIDRAIDGRNMDYEAEIIGDYVIAADYVQEEIVYAYIHKESTDEFVERIFLVDTCEARTTVQTLKNKEQVYFSGNSTRYLIEDTHQVIDQKVSLDYDPHYTLKDTYFVFAKGDIGFIDARFSAFSYLRAQDGAVWWKTYAYDGGFKFPGGYEPEDNIRQTYNTRVVVDGTIVFETPELTTILSGTQGGGITEQAYDCEPLFIDYDAYVLGQAYVPNTAFGGTTGVAQLVVKRIDEYNIDMVISDKLNLEAHTPIMKIIRFNTLEKKVVKIEDLAKILQIGGAYVIEDTTPYADSGIVEKATHSSYAAVGII